MSNQTARSAPDFDLASAIPELGDLQATLERRDWPAIRSFLSELAGRDDDQVVVATGLIAETPGVENFLDEVVRAEPDDLEARALRAYRRIVIGWEARSSQRAAQVSDQQFAEFHRHLTEAEVELIELCGTAPRMTLPWYLRLMTARGLELGQSEAQRRFDRLARISPHHFGAQQQLLQRLCPKWGGSWPEAFEFARACAQSAPGGGASHGLIPIVHFEQWIDLDAKAGESYLREEGVRAELAAAAQHSVFHPDFEPNLYRVDLHSLFAILHSVAGRTQEARVHFEALGDAASEHWYGYFNDPIGTYRKHRSAATARWAR